MATPDGFIHVEADVNFKNAEKSVKDFGNQMEKDISANMGFLDNKFNALAEGIDEDFEKISKSSKKNFKDVETEGGNSSAMIAGAFAGVAMSIANSFIEMAKSALASLKQLVADSISLVIEFDDAMRGVQATLGIHGEEAAETLKQIEDAAREMGATTQYTAMDGANALQYMAQAGLGLQDSLELAPVSLQFASAGNMEIAESALYATQMMKAMDLELEELPATLDMIAKSSQISSTSISQMSDAILTVGATAPAAKQDMQDVIAVMAVFSNNAITASEAGTSYRNMLRLMTSPGNQAQEALDKLGVSAYDSSGNIRQMTDVFKDMRKALDESGYTDQERANFIEEVFGTYNSRAANALLKDIGDVDEIMAELTESGGTMEIMAEIREGGTGGMKRELESMTEEIMLTLGRNLEPILQIIIPMVNDLLSKLQPIIEELFGLITEENLAAVGEVLQWVSDLTIIFAEHLLRIGKIVIPLMAEAFTTLVKWLTPTVNMLKVALPLISRAFLFPLQQLANMIKPIYAALRDLFDYLQPVFEWVGYHIGQFIQMCEDILEMYYKLSKKGKEEFDKIDEEIIEVTEEVKNLDDALTDLDGKEINMTATLHQTTSGGYTSGSSGGGGGGGSSGGSSQYASTVYAVKGISYGNDGSGNVGYYNSKTGASVSEAEVKQKFNANQSDPKYKVYHSGGIVDGVGDVPALLEAGEMVLTKGMQSKLFGMINNASYSNGGDSGMGLTDIVNALTEAIKNTPLNINNQVNAVFNKRTLAKELIPEFETELKRLGQGL
jgi:phage tail tape measure protein, TP901 family, core region